MFAFRTNKILIYFKPDKIKIKEIKSYINNLNLFMLSFFSRRLSRSIFPLVYRFSETTQNFKKVVDFEKMKSTLAEIHDPNEILNLYIENQSHFSKGDLVTALRGICRSLKSVRHIESSKDNDILKNSNFQALVNSTAPIIDKLSSKGII